MTHFSKIAFIGLGTMGGPMAAHLARAGHSVTAYNRTASRAEDWLCRLETEGLAARLAPTPAQAAAGCEFILTCVGNDHDLEEVLLGPEGAMDGAAPGSLLIDHSTISPATARQIAELAHRRGFEAIDAPVSGGQAGAENGALSIMCGGTETALERARPVMAAYGSRIIHIGDYGSGQAAKSVNQICIAGIVAGLSEGLRFAQGAQLDLEQVLAAISGGAAQSWQMDNRWDTMARGEFDFGFAIDWMRKDLGIALAEGRAHGIPLPVTALVDQFYAQVQNMGGGRQDTSALIRHLAGGGE